MIGLEEGTISGSVEEKKEETEMISPASGTRLPRGPDRREERDQPKYHSFG